MIGKLVGRPMVETEEYRRTILSRDDLDRKYIPSDIFTAVLTFLSPIDRLAFLLSSPPGPIIKPTHFTLTESQTLQYLTDDIFQRQADGCATSDVFLSEASISALNLGLPPSTSGFTSAISRLPSRNLLLINLTNTSISDLRPLAHFCSLRWVYLDGTCVDSCALSSLASSSLEFISLNHLTTHVLDLAPLCGFFPNLRGLSLVGTRVRNLHILTHKLGKQLNRLDLTDTIMIEEQGLVTGLPSRIPRSVC